MQTRSPVLAALSVTVFVLLAVGGLGAIVAFGLSATATPPPAAVVVVLPHRQSLVTPTERKPPDTSDFVHLALNATAQPTETPTATLTASATLLPTVTFTPSTTPTSIGTPTPTATVTNTPPPGANGVPASAYLPAVSQRARAIYQYGLTLGNNPNSFARLGDCHSSSPGFLGAFDLSGSYRLGQYGYLQDVINHYLGSFARQSQAAYAGFHMGMFFSPLWANPNYCHGAENVMDCEYRLYKPSVIFINVGTLNDQSPDEEYERFVRPIIEYWIGKGVVPILNTKADNLEGGDRFNIVMRRLASEYDVPLWDFARVAHTLPNNGLQFDKVHLSNGAPDFDDRSQMLSGRTIRNLTGLQALDVVWRGLH